MDHRNRQKKLDVEFMTFVGLASHPLIDFHVHLE